MVPLDFGEVAISSVGRQRQHLECRQQRKNAKWVLPALPVGVSAANGYTAATDLEPILNGFGRWPKASDTGSEKMENWSDNCRQK